MRIETENLIIRNFELKDKDDLCEYMLQRVNEEFEGYPDFTADKAENEINYRSKSEEFFAIELKQNHKVIGNIYFGKRDFEARELGYVLNNGYLHKGIGTEACRAFLDNAFSNGVRRVYAECSPDNTASWKLMEKLGLAREAHFKKNVSFHNDENGKPIYWDTYVYAKLNPKEE